MIFHSLYEDAVGGTAAEDGVAEETGRRAVGRGGMLGNVVASCGNPGKFETEPGRVEIAGSENVSMGENAVEGKPKHNNNHLFISLNRYNTHGQIIIIYKK